MSHNAATPTAESASWIDQRATHQVRRAATTPKASTRRRFDRRFRNPRFAPESLERKLSPSATIAVAAEVFILVSAFDSPTDTTTGGDGSVPTDDTTGTPTGPPIP